tara:strand:- start:1037 stop:1900 length:864 start_codon:yes stop_codon:yes gene_type:complete
MATQMLPGLLQLAPRLAEPARWLLVIGIAYTLATSVLYFLSPPASEPTAQRTGTPAAGNRQPRSSDTAAARNLFGVADATAAPAARAARAERAVETSLPLELHGVFVANQQKNSAAIVARKGKPGQLYNVGEKLPGNAHLIDVHTHHIVLNRAGVRESLMFPDHSKGHFVAEEAPAAATVRPTPRQQQGDDQYRSMIRDNPSKALSRLGVQVVSNGSGAGYRVGELADSSYLSQTGLQPGDIILSINDKPVGDVKQDREEIDNVLAQGKARLEVQRGARRFFVTGSL